MNLRFAKTAVCTCAIILGASVVIAQQVDGISAEPGRITELPKGYRNFLLISIAHEAGSLNDIRAVVGNEIAMKAYKSGRRPFPDGAVIVRLAYKYVPSERNNAIFGQQQSFIAGEPTNIQVDAKNSRKWSKTGGWGFGQFVGGKSDPSSQPVQTCFACHNRLGAPRDLVFTDYAP